MIFDYGNGNAHNNCHNRYTAKNKYHTECHNKTPLQVIYNFIITDITMQICEKFMSEYVIKNSIYWQNTINMLKLYAEGRPWTVIGCEAICGTKQVKISLHLYCSKLPRRSKLRCNQNDHFVSGHFSYPPLLLLFRKKARLAYLFECSRTHDGSLSLPPFYECVFGIVASELLLHDRSRKLFRAFFVWLIRKRLIFFSNVI